MNDYKLHNTKYLAELCCILCDCLTWHHVPNSFSILFGATLTSSTEVAAVSSWLQHQLLFVCLEKIGADMTLPLRDLLLFIFSQPSFLFSASWPTASGLSQWATIWLSVTSHQPALTQTGCHCGKSETVVGNPDFKKWNGSNIRRSINEIKYEWLRRWWLNI